MENTKQPEPAGRPWLPFAWIIAACALAHLWCLGSVFFLDDGVGIQRNEIILTGRFWDAGLTTWTQLWEVIQYRLFGISAPGFHAVNWLLHTAVACVLFGFGRDFLKDRAPWQVAFFGALLFAVHPLGSEIPNYARTQDLAWVTLFSLSAAWAVLRFLRGGGRGNLLGCAVCILGATFSKGPGLFHALMMTGAVGLAFLQPEYWKLLRRHAGLLGGAAAVVLIALWVSGGLAMFIGGTRTWSEPRFIGHAYTISRVFWEFAWRSVIPISLSADHHIAETLVPAGAGFWNIPDTGAQRAAAAFLVLAAFSVFLAWRKSTRLFGVCLFLYVATMLFRVLYLIPEFMPEYRIYPGLPWFCLGAAIALAAAWRFLFDTISPRIPAVILLGVFAVLSAKRSFVWHDLDSLTADILTRYPARARAVWELDDRDIAAENWQAVIDRHTKLWPGVEREFVSQNQRLAPARELPSGDFVLAMVAHMGRYARAIAHAENPVAGLRVMAQLEAHMKRMQMTPENKPLEWGYFFHDKALILEMAGKDQAAIELLRQECVAEPGKKLLKRLEEKQAGEKR